MAILLPITTMKPIYLFVFLILFVSCSKTDTPKILTTYEANKEKWDKASIQDYSYVFRISCFCTKEYTEPKNVLVKAGEIVTVNEEVFSKEKHNGILTINDLFEEIEGASSQDVAILEVTYDSSYGFPSTIFIDRNERIVDEEMNYSITDFTPH